MHLKIMEGRERERETEERGKEEREMGRKEHKSNGVVKV